jgi:hypothetical protein
MYPRFWYTGRLPWNPPGEMTLQEIIAKEGAGFQSNSNRYGDYSHMSLDPNGHTFWCAGGFIGDNGVRTTQVFSFDVVGKAGLESYSSNCDLSAFQLEEQLIVGYDENLNEEVHVISIQGHALFKTIKMVIH